MFLHSGAALHRHEFSAPLDTSTRGTFPRRSTLARSTFPAPIPRRISTYEKSSPVAVQPARPLSDHIPPGGYHARFQESEGETMSEDARSIANSETTSEVTSGGGRRRRRTRRTSTTFHLAHPAPTLTQRQRLFTNRSRLLLQLQRLSLDSRPEPAVDVLPAAVAVSRLVKRFPRMCRVGKAELGPNDVIVVQSEEYNAPCTLTTEEADSDEDNLANRDLVAVICQMPKEGSGMVEIVLNDGSVWVATPLPNGLYEFVCTDENGNKTTARWVKRSSPRTSADMSCTASAFKYTFSIIDPNSRRHPILGSITQNTLDIPDSYTSVSSSAGRHPPTTQRLFPGEAENDPTHDEPIERTTHPIDEDIKKLIQVTGVWVALRQGVSPYFRYNDAMASIPATTSSRAAIHGRARSVSLTPEATQARHTLVRANSSTTPESNPSTLAAVGGNVLRSYTTSRTPSTASPPLVTLSDVPKRSASAGIALMQRVRARRVGNGPSAFQSDSEAENVLYFPTHPIHTVKNLNANGHAASTPPSLALPGSSTTTPDTPTRPQRRVQSAYVPPSRLQTRHTVEPPARHSIDVSGEVEVAGQVERPKVGRWKAFTNLFRRLQLRPNQRP